MSPKMDPNIDQHGVISAVKMMSPKQSPKAEPPVDGPKGNFDNFFIALAISGLYKKSQFGNPLGS